MRQAFATCVAGATIACAGLLLAGCADSATQDALVGLAPDTVGDAGCVGDACSLCPGCECASDADCAGKDDANLCNGTLYCDLTAAVSTCKPKLSSIVKCAPSTACATNACVPATGKCAIEPAAAGAACDDGDACTEQACDGAGGCAVTKKVCVCTNDQDCEPHEDGDLCNGTLRCDKSGPQAACVVDSATKVTCPATTAPCRSVECVPATGSCLQSIAADGAACDDDDKCTTGDACSGGACRAAALSCACTSDAACAPFDDGDLCNGTPFCNKASGKCQPNPASLVVCPTVDDTACRTRVCEPSSGGCVWSLAAAGKACDDGNPCTTDDACASGECGAGKASCECQQHSDCAAKEDGNLCNGTLYCNPGTHACEVNPTTVIDCAGGPQEPCKTRVCVGKTGDCAVQLAVEGTPCSDGEPCTSGDACKAGVCTAGAELVCPCLADSDCSTFEDADLCNGTLYCDKSGKTPACVVNLATVVTCTTALNSACATYVCNKTQGTCSKHVAADGDACHDGKICTSADRCQAGACGGTPRSCDDANACTTDSCSEAAAGCVHKPVPCDDGNLCTADSCAAGTCSNTPVTGGCDDGSSCTHSDLCALGQCAGTPLSCADGNSCTADACVNGQGCTHTLAAAGACDDGNACTGADKCFGTLCVGLAGSATPCDDSNTCTADTCHPAAGCLHVPVPGISCSDGNACSEGDSCEKGVCSGNKPVACGDNNPCTEDSCDAANGCVHLPFAATCSDGDACTTGDACKGGACVPATVLPCECSSTADCEAKGGLDRCQGVLFCDKSTPPWRCRAVVGTEVVCADGGVCRPSTCDPQTGACKAMTAPDGSSCPPLANRCKAGVCKAGECTGTGAAVDCDDNNPCTADVCAPSTGCANAGAPLNGKLCDDGSACTNPDRCAGSLYFRA